MAQALRHIDQISQTVRGRLGAAGLNSSEEALRKLILRHYADHGCPPSRQDMLALCGFGRHEAVEAALTRLHEADIITVKEGEIVSAYPFATASGRNRVQFDDGRSSNALCSTDALGIHFMLDEALTAESECPHCGATMAVRVEQGKIIDHQPEAMVEFIPPAAEACDCVSDASCPYMNFFCSLEHLEMWRADHADMEGGEIYTPGEVLEHGRDIFEDFLA